MNIDDIKAKVDLHELADRLGIRRERGRDRGSVRAGKALYHSPHREDKNPSLSIFDDGRKWKDFVSDAGGSAIDLVMHVRGCDAGEAIGYLHDLYGWPRGGNGTPAPARKKELHELIADRCMSAGEGVMSAAREYLTKTRALPDEVVARAIKNKTVGANDWTSDKIPPGESGHGGPAVAFIVRSQHSQEIVAVDFRYLDAETAGRKTGCQGSKHGHWWTPSHRALEAAHTVVVVESPINALTVEAAGLPGYAAVATRGLAVQHIDWRPLRGKSVLLCFDADKAADYADQRSPGREAAYRVHEAMIGIDVSCMFIDQREWPELEVNDLNDVLVKDGPDAVKAALRKIEEWLIPGLAGDVESHFGKPRVYLPPHDFVHYWKYRTRPDFTMGITKNEKDENGEEKLTMGDVASFRVAALSRIKIASSDATMGGGEDLMPSTQFAVSVQTARHKGLLQRKVFTDAELHNLEHWQKLGGSILNQTMFKRLISIYERAVDIGAREAANFVGLCYRNGRLAVNEGPDCYFRDPQQQCPYHSLIFPSGSPADARAVIGAYQATMKDNAGMLILAWALGAHLKVILGFWPHLELQAPKASGKSTFAKHLERTIGMTMLSGQNLKTEFRLVTSCSHTSQPIGWEELSAQRQDIIDKAVAVLQESYNWTLNRRGSDMTEFLLSAPVLIAGEDVPVRSVIGKLVRSNFAGRKNVDAPLKHDLPRFPVRQWLQFLADKGRAPVQDLFTEMHQRMQARCAASDKDPGAARMVTNYAAIRTAWQLLTEFAGIDEAQGDFPRDLVAEMNKHIAATTGDRQPWVWIVERLFSEIAAQEFRFPYQFEYLEGTRALLVRTGHVMDHISRTSALREVWNALPVKSDRVFKQQLADARVIITDRDGAPRHFEKSIGDGITGGKRVGHMIALDLAALEGYGVYAVGRADVVPAADEKEGVE